MAMLAFLGFFIVQIIFVPLKRGYFLTLNRPAKIIELCVLVHY